MTHEISIAAGMVVLMDNDGNTESVAECRTYGDALRAIQKWSWAVTLDIGAAYKAAAKYFAGQQ